MSLPSKSEKFAELIEHIAKAQEAAATLAHLTRDEDHLHAQGWLAVSEMFKKTNKVVIDLATKGRLH